MVWCRLLDHCPDALGQHLLCLEDERSHEALDLQESEHKAGSEYWRLELIKAMPSTDGWEGQMELVELDGA